MTEIDISAANRVRQGDIYREVEYIESADDEAGIVAISKLIFPLIVVLTQDCDLEWDFIRRFEEKDKDQNKLLLSVIVAPIYNFEHFLTGEHLSEIDFKMKSFNRKETACVHIIQNQNPRYHYLEFPKESKIIPAGVIDFKHYFAVNVKYLQSIKETNFVCKIKELYREELSQRFAYFLSRIGLPSGNSIKSEKLLQS